MTTQPARDLLGSQDEAVGMSGMTPERLAEIEDRLPDFIRPGTPEHDVLVLIDEVWRLQGATAARQQHEALDRQAAARALREAQGDIKARIQIMSSCGADGQYLDALHDAWGLLNNRVRSES